MSASSCSSAGVRVQGRGRAADIIDLDHYMRSAVKPHRKYRARDELVVDAGGVDRAPRAMLATNSDSSAVSSDAPRPPPAHSKRQSHDSGLSDGSYVRRRQKTYRYGGEPYAKEPPPHSSPSAARFRLACEKALREQQEQITRVAQLCERLVQPAAAGATCAAQCSRSQGPRSHRASAACDSASSDTSDVSSQRRRSDSCRTYKIIMSKLDELNRLFTARRTPSPRPPQLLRLPTRAAASSGSVSVCDKRVATEPPLAPVIVQTALVVAHSPAVDIAPATLGHSNGDGSDVECEDRASARPGHLPQEYDLDNPVHFYQQAKRLQALHVLEQRDGHAFPAADRADAGGDKTSAPRVEREAWLCAACRGYWRHWRAFCRRLPLLFAPRGAD